MENKKNRGRSILIASMVLAFIAAAAVYVVMLQFEKKTLSLYEKGMVYIAKKEIAKGQVINGEDFGQYMEAVEMEAALIPVNAIRDENEIREMICVWNVDQGVVLTNGMFENVNSITEKMREPVIAGLRADDIYQVSGGILRSGDRIHIFMLNDDGSITLKWSNICIQQAFDNAGNAIPASDHSTVAQRLNIYLDKSEVRTLYSELNTGNLRVVKVCD